MSTKCAEENEWLEEALTRQRVLFQEQLDQHHRTIIEAIVQAHAMPKCQISGLANGDAPRNPASSREDSFTEEHEQGEQQTSEGCQLAAKPRLRQQNSCTSIRTTSRTSVHKLVTPDKPEEITLRIRVTHWLQGPIGNIVGICIILNSMTMFVHAEWLGSVADASLGIDTTHWTSAELAFGIVECLFAVLFLLELLLNCYAFGFGYFKSCFNILDSVIVLITTLEVLVLAPIAMDSANVSTIRLLRLVKIARAFKIARTMCYFNSLRLLISSFVYSLASLFWSMVVMFLLILICALFLCQTLHDFIIDEHNDLATRIWVHRMYGSGHRAMYTAFELTFSGCWPNYVRGVIEEVNPLYAIFFVFYITVIFFGMIRVISALFIKETFAQATQDTETMVWERQRKGQKLRRELEELHNEADLNGDDSMDLEEWDALLSHPKVVLWLRELGIEAADAHMIFDLLDDGDGKVTKKEFVNGVSRLKGEARAQDLVPVAANCERLLVLAKRTLNTCERLAAVMDKNADIDVGEIAEEPPFEQVCNSTPIIGV